MRRLIAPLAALALTFAFSVQPVLATNSFVTMYKDDGFSGTLCSSYSWDADLSDGISNGVGSGTQCDTNFNNQIESLRFHFHYESTCWKFYTGTNYSGTVHNFHDQFEGYFELPGVEDNIFGSFSKGTQGAGSACIAQHP